MLTVTAALNTTEAIFGTKCLKGILLADRRIPTYTTPPIAPSHFSLHSNLHTFDNFELYDDTASMSSVWKTTSNVVYTEFSLDASGYNLFTFYAKAVGSIVVAVQFIDNTLIRRSHSYKFPLTDVWKRYEVYIDDWNICDPTNLQYLTFDVYGTKGSCLFLDEIHFLDMREISKFGKWISLAGRKFDRKEEAVTSQHEIAGNFGNPIRITQLSNDRNRIELVSNVSYQDEEISYINSLNKDMPECYLRAGVEGQKIIVTGIKNSLSETYKGLRRKIEIDCVGEV